MCVATHGRILSIDNTTATVEFSGNRLPIELGLVKARVGDSVLFHAGCALQVLSDEDAAFMDELFSDLNEAVKEEFGNV